MSLKYTSSPCLYCLSSPSKLCLSLSLLSLNPLSSFYFHPCFFTFNYLHSIQRDLFVIQRLICYSHIYTIQLLSISPRDKSQILSLAYKTSHRLASICLSSSTCCSPDTLIFPSFLRGAMLTSSHRNLTPQLPLPECLLLPLHSHFSRGSSLTSRSGQFSCDMLS